MGRNSGDASRFAGTDPGILELAKRDALFIAAALVASFALHAAHLWFLRAAPTFNVPIIDSSEYLRAAKRLLDASAANNRTYLHSPLYEWFVASGLALTGYGVPAVRWLGVMLNLLTSVFIYGLGARISGINTGRFALAIWVLYAPVIYFATEIINVPLILFFNVLGLWLFTRALKTGGYAAWGLTGLVFGLSFLTRPDVLPFAAFLGIGAAILSFKKGRDLRPIVLYAVILAAMPALVGVVNWQKSGHYAITPRNGGFNFFLGNNPDYKNTMGIRPGNGWSRLESLPRGAGLDTVSDPGNQRFFYGEGLRFAANDPGAWLSCLGYKIRTLVNGYELPESFDLYAFRAYSPVMGVLLWPFELFRFPWAFFFPLAVAGAYVRRRRLMEWWWLWGLFPAYSISLLGYWNSSRYRMPLVPLVVIFSAVLADAFLGSLKNRRRTRLAGGVAVLAVSLVLFNVPYDHFSKRYDFLAEMYAFSGMVLAEEGRFRGDSLEEGLRRTDIALERNPAYAHASFNRAWLLAEAGRAGDAEKAYRETLLIDPSFEPALTNLGKLLADSGREDEALDLFTRAVASDPLAAVANCHLGSQLDRKGRTAEALPHLAFCAAYGPKKAQALNNLAIALHRLGREEEAEEGYRASLAADPRQPAVLTNLGILLVNKGKREEAREVFNRALSLDPSNSKAKSLLELLKTGGRPDGR